MHVGGMSCVFTQVPWPNRYMMYLGRSLPHAFAKALKKFGLVLHYFRKSLATWRHLLHYSRVYLPSEGRNALSNLSLKPVSTFARTSLCEMLPRSILDTSVQIGLISLIHVDFWVSWLTFSLTSFYHLRPISSFSIPFHRDAYLKGKKPSCLFTGKHLVQSFKSCQSSRFDSALRRRAWQRKCEPQTMLMCKMTTDAAGQRLTTWWGRHLGKSTEEFAVSIKSALWAMQGFQNPLILQTGLIHIGSLICWSLYCS